MLWTVKCCADLNFVAFLITVHLTTTMQIGSGDAKCDFTSLEELLRVNLKTHSSLPTLTIHFIFKSLLCHLIMSTAHSGNSIYPDIYQSTGYYVVATRQPSPFTTPYPTSSWPGVHTAPMIPRSLPPKVYLPPINTKVGNEKRPAEWISQPIAGYEGVRHQTYGCQQDILASLQRANANHGNVGSSDLVTRARAACRRSQYDPSGGNGKKKYFQTLN